MKTLEERINTLEPRSVIPSCRRILKSDSSVTFQTGPDESSGAIVAVCQLQDGSRTMTSVVQYAFMVLVNPGGKGTRYSN